MKLNLLDYMEVKSDSGSCPNWVFIDLVHECTNDENGIDWCETLLQFVKDLDDYIYGKKNWCVLVFVCFFYIKHRWC